MLPPSTRLLALLLSLLGSAALVAPARAQETRDQTWFLRRLRSLDHLPAIEPGVTALASTWDRSGGNDDGQDFKRIEGRYNILLDVDGPGCIHRMFVGKLGDEVANTRLQILLDGSPTPVIDVPVRKFFDDRHGPVPFPLVFHRTYPGTLVPLPYAKHCRVQLFNNESRNWGRFWQITYTTYPAETKVTSFTWPPGPGELQEMQAVSARWLEAQHSPPAPPAEWSGEKRMLIPQQRRDHVEWKGPGVVRQWRVSLDPDAPDLLHQVRVRIFWDGATEPSVDAPLASFFGYASRDVEARYSSMLMGLAPGEGYCCIPMPFAETGRLTLSNEGDRPVKVNLNWLLEPRTDLPGNWGRFHATYRADRAEGEGGARVGPQKLPAHVALEQTGQGKYVGLTMQVIWPWKTWWGEGDWLIWTDEDAWPPRYHGTGSEEYFNSGWSQFDRKAVSGYSTVTGPERSVYTFHLNEAMRFEKNIRVMVETTGADEARALIAAHHPYWCTTAFWYAPTARPAHSSRENVVPGDLDYVRVAATRPAESRPAASAPAATRPK